MSRQLKNRIKCLALLMVFSVNIIAGFACSVGLNMGYNKTHHQHKAAPAATTAKKAGHAQHQHHAPESSSPQPGTENKGDDCCDDIAQLGVSEKTIAQTPIFQTPVFLAAFVSQFLLADAPASLSPDNAAAHYLRRSWRLHDHTDLRIVIQSFQI